MYIGYHPDISCILHRAARVLLCFTRYIMYSSPCGKGSSVFHVSFLINQVCFCNVGKSLNIRHVLVIISMASLTLYSYLVIDLGRFGFIRIIKYHAYLLYKFVG